MTAGIGAAINGAREMYPVVCAPCGKDTEGTFQAPKRLTDLLQQLLLPGKTRFAQILEAATGDQMGVTTHKEENMWSQIFRQGSKKLGGTVRDTLASEFRIEPQVVARLRCFMKRGRFAGYAVRYIRVFDPALISDGAAAVRKYSGLDAWREALLFEGHLYKDQRGDSHAQLRNMRPSQAVS